MKKILLLLTLLVITACSSIDNKGFYNKGENVNIHSITGTRYDEEGYNIQGYNENGYDKEGYDKYGYDVEGFDREGYNKRGWKEGITINKFTKGTRDLEGYYKNGYNSQGYDKEGYNKNGYNVYGYDKEGYNELGYNKKGYNKEGYNRFGYDKEGYDKKGWSRVSENKETGTEYDKEGYNKKGYNKEGYNRFGYDKYGWDKEGWSVEGYNLEGYNKEGYNLEGYNKKGYDKEGYDVYGLSEKDYTDTFIGNIYDYWIVNNYVDEFKEPTSKKYIKNSQIIKGTFSNSATTNSSLTVYFLIDSDEISMKLLEYDRYVVKNSGTNYLVRIKDNSGKIHRFTFRNFSDRLSISSIEDMKEIHKILLEGGSIKFNIEEKAEYSPSTYFFEMKDVKKYKEALISLLKN